MKEIESLIRPELLQLKPYSSARDEFKGRAEVYIDANENPFESEINRYPDPLQVKVKQRISQIKEVASDKIFLGNGSDEVLDLIFRLFCIPGQDEVIITPPTYGMYKVLAGINNVHIKEVDLDENFQLDVNGILKQYERRTKILFLCSPNNPVGNTLNEEDVIKLCDLFPGIIVIDEAYIDFAKGSGYLDSIDTYPRLIVIQTFSKAWGMAGLRLGMAFANPFLISQLNKIKPPYNVNALTQKVALEQLSDESKFKEKLDLIISERLRLRENLIKLPMVNHIHDSEANFLLCKFDNADFYYGKLVEKGIIVRNRSKQKGCANCLRITIGMPEENNRLINTLKTFELK